MISPYSIPAILAFLAKLAIFVVSRKASLQDKRAGLFRIAVLLALGLNIAEFIVLQRFSDSADFNGVVTYYAISALVVPFLVHLAVSISVDTWDRPTFRRALVLIYGPGIVLATAFVFGTPLFLKGVEDLRGYTVTGIPGPLFGLYEAFLICSFVAIVAFPIVGLRRYRNQNRYDQCKLWLAATTPLAVLVITVLVLLKLNVRWFNITVTSPLLIALMFATIGYVIHQRPIIELDFYIPGSKGRKRKKEFYRELSHLEQHAIHASSLSDLVENIAGVFKCPVALVTSGGLIQASSNSPEPLRLLPATTLMEVRRIVLIDDPAVSSQLHQTMHQATAVAIVPFFSNTARLCFWLICGAGFDRHIHSALDFKRLKTLFDQLAGLLLEYSLFGGKERSWPLRDGDEKSLGLRIVELETKFITDALMKTKGNKAEAARLLGIRANTLHYKIRRLNIVVASETSDSSAR